MNSKMEQDQNFTKNQVKIYQKQIETLQNQQDDISIMQGELDIENKMK